ncbi:MAG TPA: hypothetical protein VNO86_10000 [Candidatus Binatia bacterium]|nr:hypothetical protein [Candidatus Binatia bacterium]
MPFGRNGQGAQNAIVRRLFRSVAAREQDVPEDVLSVNGDSHSEQHAVFVAAAAIGDSQSEQNELAGVVGGRCRAR